MIKRLFLITNKWFFKELPAPFKISLCFIRGDLIVLLPFLLLLLLIGFFSIKFMCIMLGIFMAVRYLGELMYWIHQQFGDRRYRPHDLGFKNLDNNAVYILYQTFAIMWMTVGVGIVFFVLLYVK